MHGTRRVAAGAAFVGLAAGSVTTVAGLVLTAIYRPRTNGFPFNELPNDLQRVERWSNLHGMGSAALVISAAITLALVLSMVVGGEKSGRGAAVLLCGAVLAISASLATVVSRPLVEWDQLALRPITVGSELDGYEAAAFDDDVVFVLIGNHEVSQGQYAATLVAHLTAPVVAGGSLLGIGVLCARRRRDDAAHAEGPTSRSGA